MQIVLSLELSFPVPSCVYVVSFRWLLPDTNGCKSPRFTRFNPQSITLGGINMQLYYKVPHLTAFKT